MKNMQKVLTLTLIALTFVVLVGCKAKTPEQPAINNMPGTENNQEDSNNNAEADEGEEAGDTAGNNEEDTMEVAGNVVELAKCLADNGVTMYGTEWCGHCKNQKALFGDAFNQIDYVDCDADRQACLDAGVKGFPTWMNEGGEAFPGTQTLPRLAEIGNCEYTE